MPKRALVSRLLLLAGAALMSGSKCNDESVFSFFTDAEWATIQTLSNLPPVPADTTNAFADNPQAALLGKKYFFDPRFSGPLTHADNDGVSPQANGNVGETAKVLIASPSSFGSTENSTSALPTRSAIRRTKSWISSSLNAFERLSIGTA